MKAASWASGIDRMTVLLASFSGVLLFLSFPKFGVGIFAWFAFLPLLYALKEKTAYQGLIVGFTTGFCAYIGIIYWITYVVVNYGYLPLAVGIAVMLLLAAYLAIYVALFAAGVVFFRERGILPALAAPPLWTSLEYAKSHLFTGFPWENLGYSQYQYVSLIQIADITGVFGISFAVVFVNIVIYEFFEFWRRRREKKRLKHVAAHIVAGCLVILFLFGYGLFRINDIRKSEKQAPQISVALIQGNIDQSVKWHPDFQRETINIYKELTLQAAASGVDLIVWPETATPFFFQDYNDMHREVASLPRIANAWLLFGSPSYSRDQKEVSFRNSAFLLAPDGRIAGRYDKVHLVPYGEYVPLRRFFPFINKLVAGIGDFQSGPGYEPLNMQSADSKRKLGVMICYEGILPEAGRAYSRKEAGLLVNITNDAWFGNTSAPYQHLSMTTFRSVETRLYLVRAANTGISAVIDPTGKIVAGSELFTKAALIEKVGYLNSKTFYAQYGDVFVYACLLGIILIFVAAIKKRSIKHDRTTA